MEQIVALILPHAYFIALKVTLDPPEAAIEECRYVTVKIPCISHTQIQAETIDVHFKWKSYAEETLLGVV